jgi:hypothetical protein
MANGKYGRQITECFEYNLNIYLTQKLTINTFTMSRETENLQFKINNIADSQEYRYIIQNVDLGTNNCKE